MLNPVQLSKIMEESETKKERDEDLQELQQSSQELQAQVELLQQHLSAAEAQSAGLQQDLHATRYSPEIKLVVNPCLPVKIQISPQYDTKRTAVFDT